MCVNVPSLRRFPDSGFKGTVQWDHFVTGRVRQVEQQGKLEGEENERIKRKRMEWKWKEKGEEEIKMG